MEFGIVYVCCFVWDISVLHKEKAIRIIYAAVRGGTYVDDCYAALWRLPVCISAVCRIAPVYGEYGIRFSE